MQKHIKFNRSTKDFDLFLDGTYIGSRERHIEAEVELDRVAYEALANSSGPVDQAVEGALERLTFDNAQHARTADKSDVSYFRRATTAFANALVQYRKGVRPELLASGAWLIPSSSKGEPAHIVRMDGDWICSCRAAASMHWPIAMIVGIEVAHDDMQRFDDPIIDDSYTDAKRRYYAQRDARARLYTEAA